MAQVFRIANYDQSSALDLINGTLKLVNQSWEPSTPAERRALTAQRFGAQIAFKGYDSPAESFGLMAQDSMANILTALATLEGFKEKARLFHEDITRTESIWLEANANGESVKRVLLYSLSHNYPAQQAGVQALQASSSLASMLLRLGYLRHPLWENIVEQVYGTGALSSLGGKWAPTATTIGTAPARIVNLQVAAGDVGASSFYRMWIGIKDKSYSTNLNPTWELESGSSYSADTTVVADGGASGGSKMQCTFATTTALANRVGVRMEQVMGGTTEYAYYGRWLVLLRCKLSAAGQVGIQLNQSYAGAPVAMPNEEVFFTDTNWRLIELGEIQIPQGGGRHRSDSGSDYRFELQVWAERLSGTPNLDLDALVLIPASHFLYAENLRVTADASTELNWHMYENDVPVVEAFSSTIGSKYSPPFVMRDFYYPAESGVMVVAGERETQHVLSDTISPLRMTMLPRWVSLRNV